MTDTICVAYLGLLSKVVFRKGRVVTRDMPRGAVAVTGSFLSASAGGAQCLKMLRAETSVGRNGNRNITLSSVKSYLIEKLRHVNGPEMSKRIVTGLFCKGSNFQLCLQLL